jgi:hypothetical protein
MIRPTSRHAEIRCDPRNMFAAVGVGQAMRDLLGMQCDGERRNQPRKQRPNTPDTGTICCLPSALHEPCRFERHFFAREVPGSS